MVFILAVIFAAPYYRGWSVKTEKAFAWIGRFSFAFYLIHADFGSAIYKETMIFLNWNESYIWLIMMLDFVLVVLIALLADFLGQKITAILKR